MVLFLWYQIEYIEDLYSIVELVNSISLLIDFYIYF